MLQKSTFLHGMHPAHLDQIASNAEVRDYETSEVVFREGEQAEYTYLVISGKLSLELSPSTIYSKHLVDVFPGEMLGWSSLVDHEPYAATAIASEPSRVVRIRGDRLQAICEKDTQFGYEFTRRAMLALAKRLKTTWIQLAHLYVSHYLPVNAPSEMEN
jgi:CRP-like cAMP-binding protein